MYNVKDALKACKKWSKYRALYGPLKDQGWALPPWGSALVSLYVAQEWLSCVGRKL